MKGWGVCLVAFGPSLLAALADAQTAGPPGGAVAPPNARLAPEQEQQPEQKPLYTGTHFGAYALFDELPGLLLGLNIEALVLAGGLTFKYDGNGLSESEGGPREHIRSGSTLSAAYLVHNIAPVGFGPALAYQTDFSPRAFRTGIDRRDAARPERLAGRGRKKKRRAHRGGDHGGASQATSLCQSDG